MNFGLPYKGSKSGIVSSIAMNFPKAKHFYDLFGGGGAVTHYMATKKSKKYDFFHYNEINTQLVEFFRDAIAGRYNYDEFRPIFVEKDYFDKHKHESAYLRSVWSFGNSGKQYLFSKEIMPAKKSLHNAIIFNNFDALAREIIGLEKFPDTLTCPRKRRLYCRQRVSYLKKSRCYKDLEQLEQLERLERLQQLQQLQQLERLQQLEQLEQLKQLQITNLSYEQVKIEENSIVYCDIPYKNTDDYNVQFDHKAFFDWAASREFPVFISEYDIEDSRFELVYEIEKLSLLQQNKKGDKKKQEKLYWNRVSL